MKNQQSNHSRQGQKVRMPLTSADKQEKPKGIESFDAGDTRVAPKGEFRVKQQEKLLTLDTSVVKEALINEQLGYERGFIAGETHERIKCEKEKVIWIKENNRLRKLLEKKHWVDKYQEGFTAGQKSEWLKQKAQIDKNMKATIKLCEMAKESGKKEAIEEVEKIIDEEIINTKENKEDDVIMSDMKAGALLVLEGIKRKLQKIKEEKA